MTAVIHILFSTIFVVVSTAIGTAVSLFVFGGGGGIGKNRFIGDKYQGGVGGGRMMPNPEQTLACHILLVRLKYGVLTTTNAVLNEQQQKFEGRTAAEA